MYKPKGSIIVHIYNTYNIARRVDIIPITH